MHYANIPNIGIIPIGERPTWVKSQQNGIMILCPEPDGQGVVINGETYHIKGRKPFSIGDYPTVSLFWQDDIKAINAAIDNNPKILLGVVALCQIMLAKLAPEISDEDIIRMAGLIPQWQPGEFNQGDVCRISEQIWRAKKSHMSMSADEAVPGGDDSGDYWDGIDIILPERPGKLGYAEGGE